jgi:presenilin-like A22 family membrane protease
MIQMYCNCKWIFVTQIALIIAMQLISNYLILLSIILIKKYIFNLMEGELMRGPNAVCSF